MPLDILNLLLWAILHGAHCWAELHPGPWIEWLCTINR